ncbi:hypothetical protein HPT27_10580 [Permianibacter sp. IMCC34836]|uniref:head-tail joining protein n=1 Tax=Permianibacter fluminis TaxID=2738515 RepID=UPI001551EEBF|nr:hypothetical protein [Permianibacter fluminis]NQD37473.1 hypothetical protein [Permianibacter fluminis]
MRWDQLPHKIAGRLFRDAVPAIFHGADSDVPCRVIPDREFLSGASGTANDALWRFEFLIEEVGRPDRGNEFTVLGRRYRVTRMDADDGVVARVLASERPE